MRKYLSIKSASKLLKLTKSLLLLILTISLFSCKSYYKSYYQVDTEKEISNEKLNELNNSGKYLIIHDNTSAYKLTNFEINDNILSGIAEDLPKEHRLYTVTFRDKKNPYEPKNKAVLNEIHIYTTQSLQLNQPIEIPINNIFKIEIYNKDKNATTKSWVFSTLGTGLGIYIILGILLLVGIFAFMVAAG
ncbi:MAG: hypothetical protein Q8S44_03570 [Flavobacteriaceae bacterium]|nr:hypothetical protein [Flavobacteriaceae bacterium]